MGSRSKDCPSQRGVVDVDAEALRGLGVAAVLAKPYRMRDLECAVEAARAPVASQALDMVHPGGH
mgnify:CR=1 FL=1